MRTGRCLCGAVRFTAGSEPLWISHCHCESCRRTCAAGIVTFVAMPSYGVAWAGTLASHVSSPGVTRRFCPTCGTPMSYENEKLSDEVHLYLATFDDPEGLEPERHDFWSERVDWLDFEDDLLPKER